MRKSLCSSVLLQASTLVILVSVHTISALVGESVAVGVVVSSAAELVILFFFFLVRST